MTTNTKDLYESKDLTTEQLAHLTALINIRLELEAEYRRDLRASLAMVAL
jgi:hypothetical protein